MSLIAFLLLGVQAVGSGAWASTDEGNAGTLSAKGASAVYIARMADPPVVAYEGDIKGYKATKPAKGEKIDPNDPAVVRYVGYLDSKHADAVTTAGGRKVYDFRYAFNGFAAELSPLGVERLQGNASVLSVEKAEEVALDTATTPAFLGLTDATEGLWAARGLKGENVIIGMVDSGIWPESKSFSDRDSKGKLAYRQVPGFHGKCASSEDVTDGSWDANNCNRKLVAAQYYCASRGCDSVIPEEYVSPRDYNGHGTHTSSTAGGNEGVPTTGGAAIFGAVNGIAPRARIAAYKICWDTGTGAAGCNTGDAVAAIDQAVADGVDVINYSISGTRTNYLDPVEVAFLFASDAGVFVATSAGNSGPTPTTVAHVSPWLSSVAAGTHSRSGTATVTLGNSAVYTGASLTNAVGPASLVYAGAVKKATADATEAQLCFPNTLDSAQVTGKIVLCDRGSNARVEKSDTVRLAGGVGMILRNLSPSSLNADLHSIPSVHVDETDGAAIKTYIDSAGASATASLSKAVVNTSAPAPDVAAFSSRGPSIAGAGDVLKPDFIAPGVDILAAVAPPGNGGKDFDIYSGTSMSSPHVAGIAALLTQAQPGWSPAAMRSAIATTADAVSRAGLNLPFNTGSGHVRPNRAVDPGLVYDAGFIDYLGFLKGLKLCCTSSAIPSIDASDLNQPSIAVGDLAGSQTISRRVTNVGTSAATYTASVEAPAGFTLVVSPSALDISAGETKTFGVTITRVDAPLNAYRFGALTWSDGTHEVRSPIVVRPVAIAAPTQVSGTGTSGSTQWTITTGYTGSLSYAVRGLIPAVTTTDTVADDPTDNFDVSDPDGNQGFDVHDLVVPAGTTYARVSLFDENTDGADDLDLYVYRVNADSTKTLVGASAGGTSAEEVNLVNPPAATFKVYVHGWQTDGPDAIYTLFTWTLGATDAGNTSVSGPAAVSGATGTVTLSWSGLGGGQRYLGQVAYQEGATTHGITTVRIDT